MPKKAMSVTLDEMNVRWLKGRARVSSGGNVSEELDKLITAARFGKGGAAPALTSVVGMVDLSADPNLERADAALREMWDAYWEKASLMNEVAPRYNAARRKKARG
ncbi:MAG: hypothetical protein ACKOEC_01690 [Acidimicrobiia bacterium]